jgi:hypothetical protein
VRVRWLDPTLAKVAQQDRILASANLTAGFFKWKDRVELWWSEDHTLRAENTRMVVKSSINDGLLHIGSERYEQTSLFGGHIETEIDAFTPTLATASLAGLLLADKVPDGVAVTGVTIPTGRIARGVLEASFWLAVMSIGQGVYEVWGTPYDFVHLVHEVEAYDANGDPHMERVDEIENNFIPNAAAAEALAVGELIYRSRAAEQDAVTIADDLRVEPGDVLLIDGAPYYVVDFSRDLSRGATPELQLEGFFT